MSINELNQEDPALINQINSLIEVRKSKLEKLESIFIKGRSEVETMRNNVSKSKAEHARLKSQTLETINALSDEYLGGDYQPVDMQVWFAKERQYKDDVLRSAVAEQRQEQELTELKLINQNQKKQYQQAMISCEKIQILKNELSNE